MCTPTIPIMKKTWSQNGDLKIGRQGKSAKPSSGSDGCLTKTIDRTCNCNEILFTSQNKPVNKIMFLTLLNHQKKDLDKGLSENPYRKFRWKNDDHQNWGTVA